jgi:alpha-galactosidase
VHDGSLRHADRALGEPPALNGTQEITGPENAHRRRPRLTGASRIGVRRGTPLLHGVTAIGAQPRAYSSPDLPPGVVLDARTGILTGRLDSDGEHAFRVVVENDAGRDEAPIQIVVGDRLALTPPMGWMSWNRFGRQIDDALIRQTADAMVASGMHDAGYEYVCIDDFWHGDRDANGMLRADAARFPDGIPSLADYMHERGLKLGIYSDAGTMTCGRQPGSFGFERQDAETFASWGVDYLKYDYCHAPPEREAAIERYTTMARALLETDRSIVFAACEWGGRAPWEWAADAGAHLWRTTGDIADAWSMGESEWMGIVDALDRQEGLHRYAGRGWHDPDMLLAGLRGTGVESTRAPNATGCRDDEYRSQVSLWAVLAAPLLASCDLRALDTTTLEMLTNPEIVAISQDEMGLPGRRVLQTGSMDVWMRPLAGGAAAFAILNRGDARLEAELSFDALGLEGPHRGRDAWLHEDLDLTRKSIPLDLDSHATAVFVVA